MSPKYISPLTPNYDELKLQQEQQIHEANLKEMELQSAKELQVYKNQQFRENLFFIGTFIFIAVMLGLLIKKSISKAKSENQGHVKISKEKLDLLKTLYEEGALTEEEFNKRKNI